MRQNAANGAATRKARREKPIVLEAGGGGAQRLRACVLLCGVPPSFAKPRLMPLAELAGTGPDDPERLGIGRVGSLSPSSPPLFL